MGSRRRVGAVAGIGFTVSLFITGLAFDRGDLQDDAKLGTLEASIVAALARLGDLQPRTAGQTSTVSWSRGRR